MTVVILGATKGIGRAVARRLASRGDRLCLLGRDVSDLEQSARDLEIRAGRSAPPVAVVACDLSQPDTFGPALEAAAAAVGKVDTVIVTAADFATQADLESDREHLRRLLTVNFSNTVLFCEDARTRLLASGGTLCVVSSVAGDRGRKPVILYGATKAGLSHYLEGLDHKFRARGLKVVCVKPGFVKTGMTAGLRPPPFAGEPDAVAGDIVRAIDRGAPVVYTPRIWGLVMLAIRALPRAVMRKIDF
ncbi:MAG TPA: SDR family NAD(P)-dependent oxidoreductase [Vicinamibacterales bacterium]|jgi:short-subunit dehydrogenase|nr:SDR family NAD(P)-dependent oxidoreductase [Vicinamibacterales bacterium]